MPITVAYLAACLVGATFAYWAVVNYENITCLPQADVPTWESRIPAANASQALGWALAVLTTFGALLRCRTAPTLRTKIAWLGPVLLVVLITTGYFLYRASRASLGCS